MGVYSGAGPGQERVRAVPGYLTMLSRFRNLPFVVWPLSVALSCWVMFAAAAWWAGRDAGFAASMASGTTSAFLDSGAAAVRRTGALGVPATDLYELSIEDRAGPLVVRLDGEPALRLPGETQAEGGHRVARWIWLQAGFHSIAIEGSEGEATVLPSLTWGPVGGPLTPIESAVVRVLPGRPGLRLLLSQVRSGLWTAAWASSVLAGWVWLVTVRRRLARRVAGYFSSAGAARTRLALAIAAPVLVLLIAATVRLDAITSIYGPVESPGWLRAFQQRVAGPLQSLRPAGVSFEPAPLYVHKDGPPTHYRSDPYTYLAFARRMTSFYAAHYREPIYPFVTKMWLWFMNNQDVAVSFASMSFSVLAVLATYLLGAAAFSRWVGLGAALGLAVEWRAVVEGVSGGRDEAFMFVVVMFAWALVCWWRSPSPGRAMLVGLIGGAACLIRITSVSFVVPGLACMLLSAARPWRRRLRDIGLACLVTLAVPAPYLINCWIAFGDPLYSINVHANVYRATEGEAPDPTATAATYVGAKTLGRPMATLDTVAAGLTTYPFENKWDGFAWLSPVAGRWLSAAALAGLLLFVGSPAGRLLLAVLAASLVPYAVTWRLLGDWRFTEHAYPFFLVASALAIATLVGWTTFAATANEGRSKRIAPAAALGWLAVVLVIAGVWWTMARVLPGAIVRESLAAGEDVSIEAGREGVLFGSAWTRPARSGNVTVRVMDGEAGEVFLPLPDVRDCGVTLRLDPFPRPLAGDVARLPSVQIFVNGAFAARIETRWTPGRVGAYDIRLPARILRKGWNRLALVATAPTDVPAGVRGIGNGTLVALWYARMHLDGPETTPK